MSNDYDTSMEAALALLELGDDKGALEAVTTLREWARAVDADDKDTGPFRVFRGLVPARDGVVALLRAIAPGETEPLHGFARLVAALEARKDVDALARPRAVREPVIAILYELSID